MHGWRLAVGLLALLILAAAGCRRPADTASDPVPRTAVPEEFLRLMNEGKSRLDIGDATNAMAAYRRAVLLVPQDLDVHLNLAIAHLAAADAEAALREAEWVLAREASVAAAHFVKGSAHLRRAQAEEAVKALENVRVLEPGDAATSFQLGRARMAMGQWEAAISAFKEGLALEPDRLHRTARYLLAQSYLRAGRSAEAEEEARQHLAGLESGGAPADTDVFERSRFTQARVPFVLEQPAAEGVPVRFVDATSEVLGELASRCSGPVGVLERESGGSPGLFARDAEGQYRVLWSSNGVWVAEGVGLPVRDDVHYHTLLVGDLQNDRYADAVLLGDRASHLFRFSTNAQVMEVPGAGGLSDVGSAAGVLVDLDFTGKLDLLVAPLESGGPRLFRQFGPLQFVDITATSGIPTTVLEARALRVEDWNRDGLNDLLVARRDAAPVLLEKRRGSGFRRRDDLSVRGAGAVMVTGDFDNDLRPDVVMLGTNRWIVSLQSGGAFEIPLPTAETVKQLVAADYDNDGWLDLWSVGTTVRVWRNRGLAGFEDRTEDLGGAGKGLPGVAALHVFDMDRDCDSDALLVLEGGGLRFWRNDGGNANAQVQIKLVGNRSNAGGLGCRIEVRSAGLQLVRSVHQGPVEIGIGAERKVDSLLVHWFNWPQAAGELPLDCREPVLAVEAFLQEGSCPYLYAWDGRDFRFVTDFLGAAPLGLPVREGLHIESDPEEIVRIGAEAEFPVVNGRWQVRLTEELREVLYLDEAKLLVVDHAPGTEVQSTDKLLPRGPFPPGALVPLRDERPLLHAETLEGRDCTPELAFVEGRRVSPPRLRSPQLRGLAEPHGVVLDFGPLEARRPWVLVLNGWLRFGGGMANIAASHDPSLPYPFPRLEVEDAAGTWHAVDVEVGAPAGKTKTIVVDLEGRLMPDARRLRLTSAFEIHWDRIALLEKAEPAAMTVWRLGPQVAELRYRGFSALRDLPSDWPLTPEYGRVSPHSPWTVIPQGWSTRYGDVRELVSQRDEGLVLVHSGDELSLEFSAAGVPPLPPGWHRDFFLYVDGWDKDSDYHVTTGTEIGPLPYHGQDDQRYGREERPAFPSDAMHERYNTRWVDGRALQRVAGAGR